MNREDFWAFGLDTTAQFIRGRTMEERYAWAARFGRFFGGFFPSKKEAVKANLRVINAWSGKSFQAQKVFENFGRTLADFFVPEPVQFRVEGREKAEEARRRNKGVIFLTSHLGHWELGGRILADWGWPATAVFQPYRSLKMQKFIQKRRAPGLNYLAVGEGAAAGMARVLRQRGTVAILGDRPFGEDGSPVTLCGGMARFPRGPFVFACRYGAPVVPGFVIREAPGRYRGVVEDPLWPFGKGPRAVDDLLNRMARVMEKYIALHGEQWYCFEKVWE